jgi:hypothetical protein
MAEPSGVEISFGQIVLFFLCYIALYKPLGPKGKHHEHQKTCSYQGGSEKVSLYNFFSTSSSTNIGTNWIEYQVFSLYLFPALDHPLTLAQIG